MTRYDASLAQLARAERTIPLASQTFSKSKALFPPGLAPQFADRGERGRIWDVDGNEYVDLVSSLAAVTMGHGDPEIAEAVGRQAAGGVTLSLAHPLEAEVAERIVELVPCAEMARFGKNGSDATSAAIRLARFRTGRDHVIVCGYHGWHDWYIGSTPRGIGVPSAVSSLAHTVTYGDLGGLERELRAHPTAAVIMEPMTGTWPADGYLASVRDLAHAHGALLVFDETITGFRFAKGGAQEYFGVTPDLASFGKGIANGFPLSAVVGPRDLMQDFEQVFFSGTFGGELLSLRAAQIVLDRVRTTDVVQQISASGALLVDAAQRAVEATDTGHLVGFGGHPSWQFINWNPDLGDRLADVKLLFMQEMCRNGVLVIATHNAMSVHDVADAAVVEAAYTASLSAIRDALDQGDVAGRLDATVVAQAATVRS